MGRTRATALRATLMIATAACGLFGNADVSALTYPRSPTAQQAAINGVRHQMTPDELKEMSARLQEALGVPRSNGPAETPQTIRQANHQPRLSYGTNPSPGKPIASVSPPRDDDGRSDWDIQWHERNGTPVFVTGAGMSRKMTKPVAGASAAHIALGFIDTNRDIFRLDDPLRELKVAEEPVDNLGRRHVKLEQSYQDVPLWNQNLVVHFESGGEVYAVNARYSPTPRGLTLTGATISAEQAIQIARDHLVSRTPIQDLGEDIKRLLAYAGPTAKSYIWVDEETQEPHLVWHVEIRPNFRDRWHYFVDAHTGRTLDHYNGTMSDGPTTARATDLQGGTETINTYQVGATSYLIDASRPIWQTYQPDILKNPRGAIVTMDSRNRDLALRNSVYLVTSRDNTWSDKVAVSAHANVGKVFDYYFATFGRKSVDNHGSTLVDVIHVTENSKPMDNAYWNGAVMAYGDGDRLFSPLAGGLDVTAHEMTHGVIEYTVGLEATGQSGALNESLADVFAVMVDREDWMLGEDVVKRSVFPSGDLRNMADPHNGGSGPNDYGWQPADMSEFQTLPADEAHDNGGIHVNNGIPNRACYLIGNAIGKSKTERIYYHVLDALYLNPRSNFVDMRLAAVQSATDLFGASSLEVDAVKKAFDTVKIIGDTGTKPPSDVPAAQGSEWIAMVGAGPYDNSLYMARPVIQSAQDVMQLTKTQVYTGSGHPVGISRDGSAIVFVDRTNNIRTIRPDGSGETVISRYGIWNSVALSPNGNKLAATTVEHDTTIYVFDLKDVSASKKVHLYNPTSEGVKADVTLYADALEWDLGGQNLVYDAFNRIPLSGGGAIEDWEVNILDVETETIRRLFPPQPEGIQLGNPSFAQNNDGFVVFDYIDEKQKTDEIRVLDLFHNEVHTIDKNSWVGSALNLGFPKYSPDDDRIVFQRVESGVLTIRKIAVVDKDQPSGVSERYAAQAQLPNWFAVQEHAAQQAAFEATPDSGIAPLSVQLHDISTGEITSRQWNFGDQQTSAETDPVHVYGVPGRYTITLTVTGPGGSSTATRDIVVSKPRLAKLAMRLVQMSGSGNIRDRRLTIQAGLSAAFAADGFDAAGNRVAVTPTWRVTGDIGSITPGGQFTAGQRAGQQGSFVVSAEALEDTLSVTVVPGLMKTLAVTPASARLTPGQSLTFKAQGFDAFGNATGRALTLWHVSGDIGTINKYNGLLTAGKAPGTGYVIAFAQNTFGDVQAAVSGSAKVAVDEQALPANYALSQNYPNPFNPETTIRYGLPREAFVQLAIHDLTGRRVRTLVRGIQQAGWYEVVWDGRAEQGRAVASGVYVYQLQGVDQGVVETRRMVLVR